MSIGRPARYPFVKRRRPAGSSRSRPGRSLSSNMSARPSVVQIYVTCLVETLRPEAGMAVVKVLERLGLAVERPEGQTCCGQPAFNGGAWDDARAMARHTLDVRARTDDPIGVPSGSG